MDEPHVLVRPGSLPDPGGSAPPSQDLFVPAGALVSLDGEPFYRISAVDRLPPFLMNLPTDTDLWMFISSSGGLTAGRRDPDGALFPYETVDRLHDDPHHTGPITLLRVVRRGLPLLLWEPLAPADLLRRSVERSLAKSLLGDRLVFEETDHEAGLTFRYRWAGSDETGWVRTAALTNLGREPAVVTLLDGLRNVLPSGAPLRLYQHSSCLVDAYKRVDLDPASGLGMFSLTARISDRPEPGEELRASTVWCHGLQGGQVSLAMDAVRAFRRGEPVSGERLLTGRRGNYLVSATLTLEPGERAEWHIAVDSGRSHVQVSRLSARLLDPAGVPGWIESTLRGASEDLRRIVGSADAFQLTGRAEASAHHLANVLYNSLRGGVFLEHHRLPAADFAAFLHARNRAVADRHSSWLAQLPARPDVTELHRAADATGDADLRRLCLEYLPLHFGRRHGDPSRPWNRFSIVVRDPDGNQALRYQGNWRDVFQNWEALTFSFPAFLPSVVAKFLDASTVDGFNPYRISQEGVEWEVLDPRDPWSGIGYWGDHQIIYLLRLLESMRRHQPGALEEWLGQELFSYADIPYRLQPYAEILAHPRSTIRFDEARESAIAARVAANGNDGKLLHDAAGTIRHASLLEKLLVPALSKLSNLVADGGIWMNTERPEWNDANNALAGTGLSVVTLCHLRRYLGFLAELLGGAPTANAPVSVEVVAWLRQVTGILDRHGGALAAARCDDQTRRRMMDELGSAFGSYREQVYANGLTGKLALESREVLEWCRVALEHVDHAIRANRREDGLYHAYNVLELDAEGALAGIHPLTLMLEGQVAALDSGSVGPSEATELLDALFASALYRRDRNSFMLYPDRTLPTFLERNRVPEVEASRIPLVGELVAAGDASLVERDAEGTLRFHGDLSNGRDVAAALDRLARQERWAGSVARDRQALVGLFVEVFGHRTFTGRSARMYAYEGLGCVYWHMVAKLLLAVQEVALRSHEAGEPEHVRDSLARAYFRIRSGLGYERTVSDFGAFPTDPYSHTPAQGGAQQPGMTGQVKEEILTRFGELGVRVRQGVVEFAPSLLQSEEFLSTAGIHHHVDLSGVPRSIEISRGALAFTYCQVPVVYVLTRGMSWIRVTRDDDVTSERAGNRLDPRESHDLLARAGGISRIEVGVPMRSLLATPRDPRAASAHHG